MGSRAQRTITVRDTLGNALPSATVTVRQQGTTTAITETIFGHPTANTVLANPVTLDAQAQRQIWLAKPKRVDLLVTNGVTSFTYYDVNIDPASDEVSLEIPTGVAARYTSGLGSDTVNDGHSPGLSFLTATKAATDLSNSGVILGLPGTDWTGFTASANVLALDHSAGLLRLRSGALAISGYTTAGLPAAGTGGRLAYRTDGKRGLVLDNGTRWIPVLADAINLKDFCAIDGVTDDSAGVALAITAANGGAIIHPGGTCLVNNVTVNIAGTRFVAWGCGANDAIFKKNANGPMFTVTFVAEYCEFSGIKFDGQAPTYTGAGIALSGAHFRMKDCASVAVFRSLIESSAGAFMRVEDCHLQGFVETFYDGAITAGQKTLTSGTATFTSDDLGRSVRVYGAGTSSSGSGAPDLFTYITQINSATSVEVFNAAEVTVANAQIHLQHPNIKLPDDGANSNARWIQRVSCGGTVLADINATQITHVSDCNMLWMYMSGLALKPIITNNRGGPIHLRCQDGIITDNISGNKFVLSADSRYNVLRNRAVDVTIDNAPAGYNSVIEGDGAANRLHGPWTVTGALTVGGALTASGAVQAPSLTVTATGANITGGLVVTGNTTLNDDLVCTKQGSFRADDAAAIPSEALRVEASDTATNGGYLVFGRTTTGTGHGFLQAGASSGYNALRLNALGGGVLLGCPTSQIITDGQMLNNSVQFFGSAGGTTVTMRYKDNAGTVRQIIHAVA